ncbi:ATP-dependent helicase/nuclease subunit A [bioreactor metagenome]|uniref:ATP-dependent helicase/nuclease subunit A n=1 Tax=bioreactor metagenome TaxID=1076179 RepID=A0A644WT72_9ZZZZ
MEARYVAERIEDMLKDGFQVTDGAGGLRKVQPGDIVILLRSPGTVLHHYVQALSERSLPWEAQGDSDFFASTEVSVALSLLQIIDNPRQDVPLISVLRSPVFGFTADRLAEIRAGAQGDFHDALTAGSIRGEQDCHDFLTQLEELRFGAGDMSTHQLIWRLYDLTNLPGLFSALPGGEERRSNLLTLYELARRFEESGHRGLYAFLTHLGRLRETGKMITPPSPGEGSGVRILSIHRSKGLEFPVVFLCGLSHRFNREDMQRPILFHQKLGVGPKGLDTERMVEYTTLAREAVKRRLESEMMAEELRLLYVAMTRAKDKLIMTHAFTAGAVGMGRLGLDAGYPAEPEALKACSCAGDWILLAALCRPEAEPLREWAGLPASIPGAEWGSPWKIERLDCRPLEQEETHPAGVRSAGEEEAASAPADEELLERLSWTYPHLALVQVPSKLTATGMKGRFLDAEAAEEAEKPAASERTGKERPLRRPEFVAGGRALTPSERGTALHLAMQYLDFSRTSSEEEIRAGVKELVVRQLLTPPQGGAVDCRALYAFFTSSLGRELRQAKKLYREFKFSILVPASDYYPGAEAGERILLQGVVDCWEETEDGITLVDFKTDRVTAQDAALRAEEYRTQLSVYARALEELIGKPVCRRVLWFFSADAEAEL